jgi:hypothetical protein
MVVVSENCLSLTTCKRISQLKQFQKYESIVILGGGGCAVEVSPDLLTFICGVRIQIIIILIASTSPLQFEMTVLPTCVQSIHSVCKFT